ncbi:hypothetical protein [Psychrobacillus vulpis]|uniref:DUF4352 domain-containing protein n=1 Tax=Psychrobacillus vulpis TaxID=2325572 RepID=A0A544TS72_9BACI|nr:hypothetical protein [Psychrobacillus vulpis]TQR20295.1 hypothetical protein FG384_07580 [Psychrobacillus vulpis]
MKKSLYILGITTTMLLAGCGDTAEENNREVTTQQDTAKEDNNSSNAEKAEQKQKVEEKAVGTRSNPLPFGDTITVTDYIYDDNSNSYKSLLEITALEMIRGEEAWTIIHKENEFNEAAPEGYEYALVKVKGLLKESETEDDSLYFSSMNFDFVSNEGEVYDMVSVVIPNELDKELYSGGSGEGYITGLVRVGDDFKISYESSEGSPVFFFVQ